MSNSILDEEWYLIYFDSVWDPAFVSRHNPRSEGDEIEYIQTYRDDSYTRAYRFRTEYEAQGMINFFAKQYSSFEKDLHKVVYCKVSVNIIEDESETKN